MNVSIFIPCFIDQLYPTVAFNMVKVLEKCGCTVNYNANQTCCGQPAYNAGYRAESKEVCRKFLNDFEGSDYIVTPSASCAGFVKNCYGTMFPGLDKVKETGNRLYEFSSFLINILKIENIGASFNAKATYHDSCAALRECGIKQEPRTLLSHVKGLEIQEMDDVETCCGFGGTFAVKFEAISMAMGDQKVTNATATGVDYIISTDMSCLMHINGAIHHKHSNLKVLHLADVLAMFD